VGLSLSKKSADGSGVSFKDRFASWWNGTELRAADPDFDDGDYEKLEIGEDSGDEIAADTAASAGSPDD
jgi:hypothetical protein